MHMLCNGNTQYHLIANIKVLCTYKLIDVILKKKKDCKEKGKPLEEKLKPCKGFCTGEE